MERRSVHTTLVSDTMATIDNRIHRHATFTTIGSTVNYASFAKKTSFTYGSQIDSPSRLISFSAYQHFLPTMTLICITLLRPEERHYDKYAADSIQDDMWINRFSNIMNDHLLVVRTT